MTYFIPDTPGKVTLFFTQANHEAAVSASTFAVTLIANEGSYNFTLPTISEIFVNRIIVTLLNGTIAINKIVFCNDSEPEG